ncbi:hypothetical protein RFN58_40900 [Streptomyces iakyrus]|uniref:hypothetical protein n=1 Tax=Streptomyces iakyrus TaxID=68219 RepID=UPI000A8BDC9A|nr:hypothetical protein [Streptomyces iakyrus]
MLYEGGRRRGDLTRVQVFSSWPPGVLRTGLDVPSAADVCAALCNIDVYAVLTGERGWSPDQVEQWWCGALVCELLSWPPVTDVGARDTFGPPLPWSLVR